MKLAKYILIFILVACELSAQGFNWQSSVRYPQKNSTIFLGLGYNFSLAKTESELFLFERDVFSCVLNQGRTHSHNISIISEIWLPSGLDALTFELNYSDISSKLEGFPYPIYYKNDTLLTKVSNDNSIKYISLSGFYKYRIFSSHFAVSFGGNIALHLNKNATHTEEVISPGDSYNDGTTSRVIITNDFAQSPVIISPILRLSYDFPLIQNIYASVHSDFSFNANSLVKDYHWRNYNFNLGISLFKGFH